MASVALTFDDGPAQWTPPILDLLAEHGARATFFVLGSRVEGNVELLHRVVAEGHEIGNHTWSHPRLTECDDERVHDELVRTSSILERTVGYTPRRFRPPRYDVDGRVIDIAAALGLTYTHGEIRPPDWDARTTSAFIATFVLQHARPGAVIGLHDGVPPKPGPEPVRRTQHATVEAVALILPRLRERGFTCVTATQLLGTQRCS